MSISNQQVMAIWGNISGPALDEAGRALSQMTGLAFAMDDRLVVELTGKDVIARYQTQRDARYYAVELEGEGLIHARIALIFTPENWQHLVAEDVEVPLDAIAQSALAEIGNVVGTAFLNVVSNLFRQVFEPTVPRIIEGAAQDLFASWAPTEKVLVTEAIFRVTGETLMGDILVVPEAGTAPTA